MRIIHMSAACALALIVIAPAVAADAEHGRVLFQACAACHTEKPDSLGPSLKGVFGRQSGAAEDYHYSNPMKRANLTWDEPNLSAYIADPQAKVKGNRMPFGGFSRPEDVADLVAYLKTYK
jgi:cytochrome c